MARLSWSVVGLIALPLLGLGCGEDDGISGDLSCAGAGESCQCDNGEEGTYFCQSGLPYCVCDNGANPGNNNGGANNGGADNGGFNNGGADNGGFNNGGENNGGADNGSFNNGGVNNGSGNNSGSDPFDAGTGGDGDGDGDGDGNNSGGDPNYAADPIIPQVSGECPTFKSGRFSFAGLSGEMEVGPKGNGDGALVFYWHGTGGQAGNFRGVFGGIGSSNVQKITSQGGIIFAVQGGSGGDAVCSGTAIFSGDFTVIDQVVACAVRDHNINPRRIYATGCSAGGLQSGCMAMRRPDYVAAIAPNSGGLTSALAFRFMSKSGHVPAAMTMHGGSGDNVVINFGTSSANLNQVIVGQGGFAIDCNHMSGHCGAPSALYNAAFEFLFAHPFGVKPKPYTSVPSHFPNYCQLAK